MIKISSIDYKAQPVNFYSQQKVVKKVIAAKNLLLFYFSYFRKRGLPARVYFIGGRPGSSFLCFSKIIDFCKLCRLLSSIVLTGSLHLLLIFSLYFGCYNFFFDVPEVILLKQIVVSLFLQSWPIALFWLFSLQSQILMLRLDGS